MSDTMIKPDHAAIAAYLSHLFEHSEGTVAVRRFVEKGDTRDNPRSYTLTPFFTAGNGLASEVAAEADEAAEKKLALYVIPGVTRGRGRAKAENVIGMGTLLADLDSGDVAAKYEHLTTHLGPPTMEVYSGGVTETGQRRLHVYWKLSKPAEQAALTQAVALRGEIAWKVGSDPAFASAHQPIRIAGSVHCKGIPKLVEIKMIRKGLEYQLEDLAKAISEMPAMPGVITTSGNGDDSKKPLDYVLTDPVHEGGVDGITRHDALTRVIGYFVRMYREDHITEKEMWERIVDDNDACVRPPWDHEKIARDTNAMLKRDFEKRQEEREKEEKEEKTAESLPDTVTRTDFVANLEQHNYIFRPTRALYPKATVDSLLGRGAGKKLDRSRPAHQLTWSPGDPELIQDRLVGDGGWFERKGVTAYNLYRPPTIQLADANAAGPWLDHIHKVYPDDAGHLIEWMAHRRQKPKEKINHAIVLGGTQGIGKDTMLEPLKYAVGPWNCSEPSPSQIMARFNGFLKAVVMRVSQVRDLGDTSRYEFYDRMKAYCAAPPDVLRVDEKNLREHSILNVSGIVLTTNYKTNGLYLPAEDRRHYVAWSQCEQKDFEKRYWNDLWGWYENGGYSHVAAYLIELDISAFDPKAPPKKTDAFWEVVDANRAPEEGGLADLIDAFGNPAALTLVMLKAKASGELFEWLGNLKCRRQVPHRLEACDYVPVRNHTQKTVFGRLTG